VGDVVSFDNAVELCKRNWFTTTLRDLDGTLYITFHMVRPKNQPTYLRFLSNKSRYGMSYNANLERDKRN
jgi:hypothetical protein